MATSVPDEVSADAEASVSPEEPTAGAPVGDVVVPGPPPPLPEGLVIPPRPPLPPVPPTPDAAEPEVAVEPEPEPEVSVAVEPQPEPEPEVSVGPQPEPVPEPEVPAEPEPAPAVRVEPEPDVSAEPEPEPEPATVPEPQPPAVAGPEVAAEDAPLAAVFDQPLADPDQAIPALVLRAVTKTFGGTRAVDDVEFTVPAGSFYGIVGPNGAGKTTTLSMIAGLLRPDDGSITVNGLDTRTHATQAKRAMGVLPDRLRTFDRLTGRQLLYYYGVLRGLPSAVVEKRIVDLARAFDLVDALGRSVSDYSTGMTKKVMLAGAMIHSPRLLVLDEPFESVDPVSSAVILDILTTYVEHGGTVILSSHGMELVERVCNRVAVLVAGQVLAEGTVDEVRGTGTLQERFLELAGGMGDVEGLEWLHAFSD
jgi:ABC-2 type transport system ATP-binding protein